MKNKDKLSQLQAIAKSVVKKETKRVNEAIKKNPLDKTSTNNPNEINKNRLQTKESYSETVKQNDLLENTATIISSEIPQRRNMPNSSKKEDLTPLQGKRFQAVFKTEDLDKIQSSKIYLLQKGLTNVSSNGIVQAALRLMENDPKLIDTYTAILKEDNRRRKD